MILYLVLLLILAGCAVVWYGGQKGQTQTVAFGVILAIVGVLVYLFAGGQR